MMRAFQRLLATSLVVAILGTSTGVAADDEEAGDEAGELDLAPWVVTALGGGALIVGGVFAFLASSGYEDARTDPVQMSAADTFDQADTFAVVGNILFLTGGTLLLTGIGWGSVTLQEASNEQNAVALDLAPTSLRLRGTF